MTYEDVIPLIRRSFPEWWDEHLSWCLEGNVAHVASGVLVGLLGRVLYDGDESYVRRAAEFGNALAASDDERVYNLAHVSFFESFHQLHPDDRARVGRHLDARASAIFDAMTADLGWAYVIQGIADAGLRPAGPGGPARVMSRRRRSERRRARRGGLG